MLTDYALVATDKFKLEDVDMVGRTEYLTVMDYLGTLILNAEQEGERFGKKEAKAALTELEGEVAEVIRKLG